MDELQKLVAEYETNRLPGEESAMTFLYTGGEDRLLEMLRNANGRKIQVRYPSVEVLDGGTLAYVETD